MRKSVTKLFGMFLVAIVASASGAAAGASAEAPEFGRCLTQAGGKFKNATCTREASGGSYEWFAGVAKPAFKTTNRTRVQLVSVSGDEVKCYVEKAPGRYVDTKELTVTLKLSECWFGHGEEMLFPCKSPEQAEGTIVSAPLAGVLGVIKRGKKPVEDRIGVELSALEAGRFMQYECAAVPFLVRGAEIGTLPANSMKHAYYVGFNGEEQFEGQSPAVLEVSINGGAWERFAIIWEMKVANEEAVEVSTLE